jgi:hypothetical protein
LSATKTSVLAAFVLVLTFAAGFIGGAATHHLLALRRPPLPPPAVHMILRHLDRRLELSDAQQREIATILQRRHTKMRGELDAAHGEIEGVLTPAQREKFRRMRFGMGPGHREHRPH